MDTFTPEERSAILRKVKSRDTKPEMVVRRLVHRLGYRYRLHRKNQYVKGQIEKVTISLK